MSISGLGGSGAGISVHDLGGARKVASPQAQAQAKADASEAQKQAVLEEIREKGLYAWAQEEKLKALKEKIRQQVLSEMGLDEGRLAAMAPEQRASMEARIQDEIERRIREAIEQAAEDEQRKSAETGRPPAPVLIDISV